jgi:hypothetical protein
MRQRPLLNTVPDLGHRGTSYKLCKHGKLSVHLLQLWTDGKHQFYTLFFRHLRIDAHLSNGVHDTYALVDDIHIDVIPVMMKSNSNGVDWCITYLMGQPSHVLRQVVNLIVEAIDLRCV